MNYLITYLQLFGIGLSFGAAGPCLLVCTPIIIAYAAGRQNSWQRAVAEILIFLTGRIFAYAILGYAAGFSSSLLVRFTAPGMAVYFRPIAGIIAILLGMLVLMSYKISLKQPCSKYEGKPYDLAGLFVLGFVMGIVPCAPLTALLLEIVLISKNALDGMLYTLSFGMGTFVSGFIVIAAVSGLLRWVPAKVLRSQAASLIFRIGCGVLLVIFGLWVLIGFGR